MEEEGREGEEGRGGEKGRGGEAGRGGERKDEHLKGREGGGGIREKTIQE